MHKVELTSAERAIVSRVLTVILQNLRKNGSDTTDKEVVFSFDKEYLEVLEKLEEGFRL